MTSNQLRYHELRETTRNHKVVEKENQRHNLAVETETQRSNIASELNNRYSTNVNYHLGYLNYLENQRSHQANEANNRYSNETARLEQQERARSNRMNESINSLNASTNIVNSLENIRTHKANEAIQSLISDRNYELGQATIEETHRANVQNESLKMQDIKQKYANLAELRRHNTVVEGETKRHNLIGEMQKNVDLINDSNRIKFSTITSLLNNVTPKISIRGGV